MTEFEEVLQECLLDLESGASNVDDCLHRYPQYALTLEPVLLTSLDLERGREARPSTAFKARVRARLTQEMRAHPRGSIRFQFMFARLTTSFAVILLALFIAGTVYAQGALPGQPFYGWKLASETIWRLVSPDPVETDLAIAERRASELMAVANDSNLHNQVLAAYLEVRARLELGMDAENEARIRLALDAQLEELKRSGVFLPELDQNVVPTLEVPTEVPTASPTLMPELPQVAPTLPVSIATSAPVQPNPTDSPQIIPALPVKTEGLPTIQVPSILP